MKRRHPFEVIYKSVLLVREHLESIEPDDPNTPDHITAAVQRLKMLELYVESQRDSS